MVILFIDFAEGHML